MNRRTVQTTGRVESVLATLLVAGTWVSSSVIAAGLLLSLSPARMPYGLEVVTIGVGLFILLPTVRVIAMLALFIEARDYRFAAIAALVLIFIGTGFAIGLFYK